MGLRVPIAQSQDPQLHRTGPSSPLVLLQCLGLRVPTAQSKGLASLSWVQRDLPNLMVRPGLRVPAAKS